jgi:HAD superfamily hydrolase (TIGR01509 family)
MTELIHQVRNAGKSVTIVSNNSVAAVTAFLTQHELMPQVDHISARTQADPELMKPNPYLIEQALTWLGAKPSECILIGDSVSDMEACKNAGGVVAGGYANKKGKIERLIAAGADIIITDIRHLLLP